MAVATLTLLYAVINGTEITVSDSLGNTAAITVSAGQATALGTLGMSSTDAAFQFLTHGTTEFIIINPETMKKLLVSTIAADSITDLTTLGVSALVAPA
jgi:hypothetical protein